MPPRDKNLRGGHLAEGLGCELLRRICAVAPVPPSEDIGIDAVCTLLRRDRRKLFASKTFAVQIKAASLRRIPFDETATLWLHDLEIPYFLMSVDARDAKATIYTCEGLFQSRLNRKVRFHLDRPKNPKTHRFLDPKVSTPNRLDFWVGEPVATFSFADLQDEAFCDSLRARMESWCELVGQLIRMRRLGTYLILYWEPNGTPRLGNAAMNAGADRAEFVRLFDDSAPPLTRMRLILDELGERDLEQCLHRLAVGAQRLGASDIQALLLLAPEISCPRR